jgi:hypothetical protein
MEADQIMEPLDYIRLQDSYRGTFVAIRDNKVIASGDTQGELVRKLKYNNLDADDVVFEYVSPRAAPVRIEFPLRQIRTEFGILLDPTFYNLAKKIILEDIQKR